jgi:hypothetical protein
MRFMIPALALSLAAVPALAQTTAPTAPATPAPAAPTAAAPATKTTHTHMTAQQRFDAANTTHDGKLTKEQAQAAHMTSTVKNWDAIDKDKKGYVTMDDMKAYAAAQRAAHHNTGTATKKPPA